MESLDNLLFSQYFYNLSEASTELRQEISSFYKTNDSSYIAALREKVLSNIDERQSEAEYYKKNIRNFFVAGCVLEAIAAFAYNKNALTALGVGTLGLVSFILSFKSNNNSKISIMNTNRLRAGLIHDPDVVRRVLDGYRTHIEWQIHST